MSNTDEPYKRTTIVFPINGSGVILGMKKRGFGQGWWNGFGGKLEKNETYEEAAVRETHEEVGLLVKDLRHVANLHFYFNDVLGVVSRAYITRDFDGTAIETDEMRPGVFGLDQLPYDTMWPADKLWIPSILTTNALPLGFIVHFDEDKGFKSIKKVDSTSLETKF
jgi:8-oxo-dGTP pyrophosphatase MutT (NUDIX family)